MRFNAAAFDAFLGDGGIGQDVEWRRSYACPCVSPTTGQPDPKHQLCAGKGRLWDAPLSTVAGVASQKVLAQWMQMGQWESGDMVMSVPQNSPMWSAGQYDRMTMVNTSETFSLPLTRGAPSERLQFTPVSIERSFWLHPVTRNVVEGGVPTISDAGALVWGSGEPPPGTVYSLTGTRRNEFYIFGAFPDNRNQHQGMRLPKRLVARKWDLFGR